MFETLIDCEGFFSKRKKKKIRCVHESTQPSKKLVSRVWQKHWHSFFLHIIFCLPCVLWEWCVRCTGMSYHARRALVWPPVRVCEIRVFLFSLPCLYRIRPQTFVMVMLSVCCTAASSLGLRDSLVSSMNEDIPQQPPVYRPLYNTQERDTPAP